MNVISTDCESYIRLMVEGRVDTNTSPQLQTAVLGAFQKNKDVVIDLLNVQYISSAGLRVLLLGHKTAMSKGGSLKIANVCEAVQSILDVTGFCNILNIE